MIVNRRVLLGTGLLIVVAAWSATPNMGINKPTSGDTNYVSKIDTALDLIDSHDHSTGKGVQISSSGIANGAVGTNQIADLGVGTADIAANAVTSAKILDGTITNADLGTDSVTGAVIASQSITTAKLGLSSVTTQIIANDSVSKVKLKALGQTISSDTDASSTITSYATVITISHDNTAGRPVWVGVIGGTAGNLCYFRASPAPATSNGKVRILRGASVIAEYPVDIGAGAVPCSAIQGIDTSAPAGTNQYNLQIGLQSGSDTFTMNKARLAAFEL